MSTYCKTIILLTIAFLVPHLVFSQEDQETRKKETLDKYRTIGLLNKSEINNSRVITLYKSEDVTIKTPIEIFEQVLQKWLEESELQEDSTLLNILILNKLANTEINLVDLVKDYGVSKRLEYHTAEIIDAGKCWVIDNNTGLFYDDVEVQYFSYYHNELDGYGGRQYLTWKGVFLQIIDYEI